MSKSFSIGSLVKFKKKYLGIYSYAIVEGFLIEKNTAGICPISGGLTGKSKSLILEPKISPLWNNDFGENVTLSSNDVKNINRQNEIKLWNQWSFDCWGISNKDYSGDNLERLLSIYIGALERKQIPCENILKKIHLQASHNQIKSAIRTAAKRKVVWDEYGTNSEVKKYFVNILTEAGTIYDAPFPTLEGRL
jgi:hypothetical protein